MTDAQYPVSVKAALRCGELWVLLRNERGEWELPGGRIDIADESLPAVVYRECKEELGIEVDVGDVVDAHLFEVVPGRTVTIICFAATGPADADLIVSAEHSAVGLFTTGELAETKLASGYRRALRKAADLR